VGVKKNRSVLMNFPQSWTNCQVSETCSYRNQCF